MNRSPNHVKIVALLAAIVLAIHALGHAAALVHAADGATAEVIITRLNVRSGPGTSYGVLRVATAGEQLQVVGQQGNCAWLKILDSGGVEGWVSGQSRFVKLSQPCATVGAADGATVAAAPAEGKAAPAPTQPPAAPAANAPEVVATGPLSGKLAYPMGRAGRPGSDVYVYDLARQQVIAKIEDAQQPQLLGDRLAIAGDQLKRGGIWRMNITGGDAMQVTPQAEDQAPTWSPTGNGIMYWQHLLQYDSIDLPFGYSVRIGQSGAIEEMYWQSDISKQAAGVAPAFGGVTLHGHFPIFLDDGRFAYTGCNRWANGGNCGIYVADLGSGKPVAVTDQPPDRMVDAAGNQLLFMSNRSGNWEIYLVQADGSNLHPLTNHAAFDGPAAFSPDGQRIAFVSNRGGVWSIYLMSSDGSNVQKLFDIPNFGHLDGALLSIQRISWAP